LLNSNLKTSGKITLAALCMLNVAPCIARIAKPAPTDEQTKSTLKMVVVLSRHGVRSPTQTNAQLNQYSAKPWPQWTVAPGELTARGALLLRQFGAWQRTQFAERGLLQPDGCADAPLVYAYTDSDQRTNASGHALAEGLMPGCSVRIDSLPQSTQDHLYHPLAAKIIQADSQLAVAALNERVNGDPAAPARDHQSALAELQRILNSCASKPSSCPKAPADRANSVTGIASAILAGKDDHLVEFHGPLATGASLAENFLLEYAEGMPMDEVGWGQVQSQQLRTLLPLHSAYFDLIHRTPYIAQVEASNLLDHIRRTLQQGATGRSVEGAIGPAGEKVVLLAGHDTNIAAVASLLNIHWDLDGRQDDTPPGAEMAFELWQYGDRYFVRVRYSIQTLSQLRSANPLSNENPPASTLPAMSCENSKEGCSLAEFDRIVKSAVRPEFIR
jgi:4-phytase / acid phosphatase